MKEKNPQIQDEPIYKETPQQYDVRRNSEGKSDPEDLGTSDLMRSSESNPSSYNTEKVGPSETDRDVTSYLNPKDDGGALE
jgi:hypothetical protein